MDQPRLRIRTVLAVASTLAIAASALACGGGGAASTAPGASAGATTQPAASAAAPSEAAPTSAPSTAAGGGGGGGAAGAACDLLTTDEAAGVIGGGAFTSEVIPGDPSYCTYKTAEGFIPLMTSLGQTDAKAGYDAWASASDSVKVSGVGDGAVWVPTLATLLVLKGDRVLGVTAGQGSDDDAKRQEWAKALAAIAIGRM